MCVFSYVDVKQLQMEAPLVGERIKMLLEQHQDFAAKIEPKFAPLENDVSVINGVLQLDQQFFTGKVCIRGSILVYVCHVHVYDKWFRLSCTFVNVYVFVHIYKYMFVVYMYTCVHMYVFHMLHF